MDSLFKKRIIIVFAGILVISSVLIGFFGSKMVRDKASNNKDASLTIEEPDESYFVIENEKAGYKLKTDKREIVGGITFYDFKIKEYKNGYQKIELMARNDGKETTKEKSFMIEPIDKNENNDTIIDVVVKPLKPGESTKIEGHFAPDITGIVNYRVKEYLLNQ